MTAVTLVDACLVSAEVELLAGCTLMGGESLRVPANTESLVNDGSKYVRQPDIWSRSYEIVFAPAAA